MIEGKPDNVIPVYDLLAGERDQLAWMNEQLARFTYRPGWHMTVGAGDLPYGADAVLIVRYRTLDSRAPGLEGRFEACRPLNAMHRDPDMFARHLQHALFDMEMHESREWLRRDGQLYDDPHADPTRWHCSKCGGVGPVRHEGKTWTCPGCNANHGREEP